MSNLDLFANLDENIKVLKEMLPIGKSFDIIGREFTFGNKNAYLVFVDGFAKDNLMLLILRELQKIRAEDVSAKTINDFVRKEIAYIEAETFTNFDKVQLTVLAGALILLIDGEREGIIIDAREYPVRSPQEPDLEKVTRGSRDGLVETIVFNTALIRRRVRDPKLTFEITNVGKRSQTDVVIGYIEDLVDKKLLEEVKAKIDAVSIEALVMAEKTLEEHIIKKKWFNPLPQAKFTERPDVVAAHLYEGHIAIIVDTSPSVMLVPVTMFHFTQHAEDYYQNPLTGTYVRWVRFLGMFFSLILLPLWLLLVYNKELLPQGLQFLGPKKEAAIPLFIQFILLELGLDLLRTSSIHTPNTLSTSLGIIGGLLLSEIAIKVGWFIPETVLYMAIAAIGTFATPSIEYANAVRIFRLVLLLFTGIGKTIGFFIGILIMALIMFTTKSFKNGKRYTWPLIPFNGKALKHLIFREPIPSLKDEKK